MKIADVDSRKTIMSAKYLPVDFPYAVNAVWHNEGLRFVVETDNFYLIMPRSYDDKDLKPYIPGRFIMLRGVKRLKNRKLTPIYQFFIGDPINGPCEIIHV